MFTDEKSKMKSMILKKTNIKPMEEEIINTKVEEKKEIHITPKKEKKNIESDEDDLEKIKNENNENIFNLSADDEKELLRINLKKNIVVRILDVNDEKYVDFCKFYKGYPTKKNIRIKYKTYLKLKDLLILNQ
jgi:hypothetical protein